MRRLQQLIPAAPAAEAEADGINYLLVKEKDGLMKIAYDDILHIEASRDYMKVHTVSGHHLIHQTMKKLEGAAPRRPVHPHAQILYRGFAPDQITETRCGGADEQIGDTGERELCGYREGEICPFVDLTVNSVRHGFYTMRFNKPYSEKKY